MGGGILEVFGSLRDAVPCQRRFVEYKTDPDFVIIARTDARAVTGLDDAIARANLYREAGADVIFLEAPQTLAEVERVAREVKAPLLANMVQGGRTPAVTVAELVTDREGLLGEQDRPVMLSRAP